MLKDNQANTKCRALKPDGTPCQAHAISTSRFCFFHDPANEEKRNAARRAGGENRAREIKALPPDTPNCQLETGRDISALLTDTINRVRRGELDVAIALAISRLVSLKLQAVHLINVEARVEELSTIIRARAEAVPKSLLLSGPPLDDPVLLDSHETVFEFESAEEPQNERTN
jgi:hypothetical protein